MNARDALPGKNALSSLMKKSDPKLNSHGQEEIEHIPGDESEESSDGSGLSSTRGLFQGVILEMENGNREGIMYGAIMGRIRFDPSRGITFIFEDAEGLWRVKIEGGDLKTLHRDLVLGRRESIRVSEGDAGVRAIHPLEAWSPPGKR